VTREASRGYWSGHEICGLRVERNSTGRSCDVVRSLPTRIASENVTTPSWWRASRQDNDDARIVVVDKRDPLAAWPSIGYSGHVERRMTTTTTKAIVVLLRSTTPSQQYQLQCYSKATLVTVAIFKIPFYIVIL